MSSTTQQAVSEISFPLQWGVIRGRVWGPDNGYPVLCLHGWADNCGSFNTLIPLLPKECRYVAIDLAGHGLSSHRPPGVYFAFSTYIADIHKVIHYLNWTKFSIIGHSLGGHIAGMFSALYPMMVDAIILLDAAGFVPREAADIYKSRSDAVHKMLQYERKTDLKPRVYTYEKAMERLLAANPTLSEQSVRILLERGLTAVDGGFVFSRDLRLNLDAVVQCTEEESFQLVKRIRPCGLIVLADKGILIRFNLKHQQRLSRLFQGHRDRNHKVVTVPGDHHVHLNNPECVAPHISEFLQTTVFSKQRSLL